jgi:hypothetical protein
MKFGEMNKLTAKCRLKRCRTLQCIPIHVPALLFGVVLSLTTLTVDGSDERHPASYTLIDVCSLIQLNSKAYVEALQGELSLPESYYFLNFSRDCNPDSELRSLHLWRHHQHVFLYQRVQPVTTTPIPITWHSLRRYLASYRFPELALHDVSDDTTAHVRLVLSHQRNLTDANLHLFVSSRVYSVDNTLRSVGSPLPLTPNDDILFDFPDLDEIRRAPNDGKLLVEEDSNDQSQKTIVPDSPGTNRTRPTLLLHRDRGRASVKRLGKSIIIVPKTKQKNVHFSIGVTNEYAMPLPFDQLIHLKFKMAVFSIICGQLSGNELLIKQCRAHSIPNNRITCLCQPIFAPNNFQLAGYFTVILILIWSYAALVFWQERAQLAQSNHVGNEQVFWVLCSPKTVSTNADPFILTPIQWRFF